ARIVAINPAHNLLATSDAGAKQLLIWDVSKPRHPTAIISSVNGPPRAVAFSPDGRVIADASDDAVGLWNISDTSHPESLTTFTFGSQGGNPAVAFSPDSHFLITAGFDSSDQIWEMNIPDMLNRLCAGSGTVITRTEWDQYVPSQPYERPCPTNY